MSKVFLCILLIVFAVYTLYTEKGNLKTVSRNITTTARCKQEVLLADLKKKKKKMKIIYRVSHKLNSSRRI